MVLVPSGPLGDTARAVPPVLTFDCSPAPADCKGWYRSSVTVKWGWLTSTTEYFAGECLPNPNPWVTFANDTVARETWCEVRDTVSGDRTKHTIVLHIDKTAPTVSAAPDRPPDYGGWFNHPLNVSFSGSDATSGVASCSSTSYSGPGGAGVQVGGTCQDVAGNVGSGSFAFNYDASPPPAPAVQAKPGNKSVALSWSTSPDSQAEVARLDGDGAPVVVYQGPGGAFTDRPLRNRHRYRYVVTLIDQAGNRASGTASSVPTSSNLLVPSKGSRVPAASPPQLIWKPVGKADYYNVQIFRRRRKVLSAWPEGPRLQLKRRWRFGGKRYRLVPGRYCWYVWPGYGKRAKRNYGKRLGKSCFRIVR
jgi:hypothetical protein